MGAMPHSRQAKLFSYISSTSLWWLQVLTTVCVMHCMHPQLKLHETFIDTASPQVTHILGHGRFYKKTMLVGFY